MPVKSIFHENTVSCIEVKLESRAECMNISGPLRGQRGYQGLLRSVFWDEGQYLG